MVSFQNFFLSKNFSKFQNLIPEPWFQLNPKYLPLNSFGADCPKQTKSKQGSSFYLLQGVSETQKPHFLNVQSTSGNQYRENAFSTTFAKDLTERGDVYNHMSAYILQYSTMWKIQKPDAVFVSF